MTPNYEWQGAGHDIHCERRIGRDCTCWREEGPGGMFLTRTKQYATPGRNYRLAWKYLYDVHCPTPVSEGHPDLVSRGHSTLAEARAWMKQRHRSMGQ